MTSRSISLAVSMPPGYSSHFFSYWPTASSMTSAEDLVAVVRTRASASTVSVVG